MRQRLLVLQLACGIAAGVADAAPVRVRVLDDASGQMVAARAYLSRGTEALLAPPGAQGIHGIRAEPPYEQGRGYPAIRRAASTNDSGARSGATPPPGH